ncbi:MAG: HPr family phosphocarrier protein [Pseudomonadota bacterium]
MDGITTVLQIINEKGLHARASARFVETVEAHDAKATVSRDGQTVGGDSIMGLLMLAAAKGTTIEVTCTGPDSELLAAALSDLIADCFGEGG